MSPFEAYQLYMAIKQHFTTGYDYFKYNGKTNVKRESFNDRNDVYLFAKLAKHRDPKGLLVSNFIVNSKVWSRELVSSTECEQIYIEWLKRQQSLSHTIRSDLSKLLEDFNSNFIVNAKGQHPKLLQLYMANKIQPETLCVLVKMTACLSYWSRQMEGDIIWEEYKKFILKYTPFIEYNADKIKEIVVDFFSQ
jgi:hypothetical protein